MSHEPVMSIHNGWTLALKCAAVFILLFVSLNTADATDTVMKVISLQHRSAEEVQSMIKPLLNPQERLIGQINTLIIKASPQRQQEIQDIIQQLDTPLTNLTITVLQSTLLTADELNAQASIHVNIDHTTRGYVDGHFADTRRLKQQKNTQLIRTLEGHPAFIKTGALHPVQSIEYRASPYGKSIRRTTQHIEATTGFKVIPRLSGTRVTLQVSPWSGTLQTNNTLQLSSADTTLHTELGKWVEIARSGENNQNNERGRLKYHYSTSENSVRMLVKVEKSK